MLVIDDFENSDTCLMKFSKSSVPLLARFHIQLFFLVLLASAPALILTVLSNINARKIQKQNTRERTVATVKYAAAKQENFVKNAEKLLTTVAQFSFLVSTTDRSFSQAHLINLRKLSPEYLDIGLIEADGTLFCSTVITNDSPNLSKWTCFARVSQSHRFAIGDLEKTGTTPNQESLGFGIPVYDEKGKFQRVFFATLDISRLRKAAAEVVLPEEASIMVLDGSGNVLAQRPESGSIGKSISKYPYVQKILKEKEAVFETPDPQGVEKLFAVTAVSDGLKNRLWVSVGIPTKTVFAAANLALLRNILIIIITALSALAAAYFYSEHFFLRPLNSLISEVRLLASGKWDANSKPLKGKGELAEVSRAFHEMAITLERQRGSLERANAELEQRVLDRTRQLEHAVKELEAFSYSVSHDLRAPVRHIAGFVNLLRDDLGVSVSAKSKRFLSIITDSVKQMGQLIDELLVFSKMGRTEMQKIIVDTSELVEATIVNLDPEIKNRNIIWEKNPLPNLQADPAMLRQVFINLISNAIKYTQPRDPARIQIGHEEKENQIVIFVRDNGVGFNMEFSDKLFGVFQRLHQHDEFEGVGIGLANVRRIIQRHGGRTWAEGKVDEGATFYFSLPKYNQ
jgi:signal transduction histidine kinase